MAPIVGSTLTTVVVFAPLGLLSGVVGDFFKALSITLSAAVLISLVLALYLIPLLARCGIPRHARMSRRTTTAGGALDRWYVATLPASCSIGRVARARDCARACWIGGRRLYLPVGSGFLPATDEGGFVIDYITPAGMALEETDARLKQGRSDPERKRRKWPPTCVGPDRSSACSPRS